MKSIKIACFLFICSIIFTVSVFAKSPVWKISKDGNHLFLGGTIHLLTPSDYPLPGAFETAYENAVILVLETDLKALETPEFQQTLLQNSIYKDGQTILDYLEPETIQRLETHLADRGIPMEQIKNLKPGMLSLMLSVVELQRLGLMGTGVDEYFNTKAMDEKKQTLHLETVYQQLEFLSKMGKGNENNFIQYTLNDLKDLPRLFESMKKAWRTGNLARLKKTALDPWKDRFPRIYHSLLVERNRNWIPRIEAMMNTKEIEFILFGALHLVGEDGILKQLEERGYTIENQ